MDFIIGWEDKEPAYSIGRKGGTYLVRVLPLLVGFSELSFSEKGEVN